MRIFSLTLLVIFLLIPVTAFCTDLYVTDSFQITLRTGQGLQHKIIGMIPSGEKVTIMESTDKWTKIKRDNGVEGWVLSRFLSEKTPSFLKLGSIEKKYEKLKQQYLKEHEELKKLRTENKNFKTNIRNIMEENKEIQNQYISLKKDSANYLELKGKYTTTAENLKKNVSIINKLEQQLFSKNIYLFLLGAGVLFIGILTGLSIKRKRRRLY